MNASTPGNLPEAVLGKFGSGSVNSGRPRRALRTGGPGASAAVYDGILGNCGDSGTAGCVDGTCEATTLGSWRVARPRESPAPEAPRAGVPREEAPSAYARLRDASIAPSSQMLCLRVSGITNRAMRNMTAGTAMGYTSAQPRLPVFR